MSENSDYFEKARVYSKVILLADILIIIAAIAIRVVYKLNYTFGAALTLIGILFVLFPYVRHQKWSEQECKTRVRMSGIISTAVGLIMLYKDIGPL